MKPFILRSFGFALSALCVTSLCVAQKHSPSPSAARVANTLDRVIQPKFQEDAGDFGAARLGIGGHDAVADAKTLTALKKQINTQIGSKHPDYTIGIFHFAVKPGKYLKKPGVQYTPEAEVRPKPEYSLFFVGRNGKISDNGSDGEPSKIANAWDKKNAKGVQAACVKALPKVKAGIPVEFSMDTERVFLRPIKANKASCLGCHKGAKRGETLGAMVYTVSLSNPVKQTGKK